MKPLQVTTKPRCKERVKNQWYHNREFGPGLDHQCPFPQWKNGYCKRHHPRNILEILRRREKRLSDQLAIVKRKIVVGLPGSTVDNNSEVCRASVGMRDSHNRAFMLRKVAEYMRDFETGHVTPNRKLEGD